ncbi:MAG: N-acetylneuraminate synthase [Sporolactobacillus sp.]
MEKSKHTFIIAEAGVNHNGDVELAMKLIEAAKNAGADAVKFQTFRAENLVTRDAPKADYQTKTTGSGGQYDMLKKLELSIDDHLHLKRYCDALNIEFMSTPFDFESADLLEKIGIKRFKISSGDLTTTPFLSYVAKFNKPMILSTGMANLGEIEAAIESVEQAGNDQISLLHCTSNYPTAPEDVNLNAIMTMKNAFKRPVGYSDHTIGSEISIAAVAMGAEIIEKHLTLDKNMEGPDHKASMEPDELERLIRNIRIVELSLGDGIKKCRKSEEKSKIVSRKSIVAKRPIMRGEKIKEDMLDYKRSENGLSPMQNHLLIGKMAAINIRKNDALRFEQLI